MQSWTPTLVASAVGVALLAKYLSSSSASAPFPPGPRGLPIIGNVLDIPQTEEWLTYAEWGRKWGGIVGAKLLGQPLIVINSAAIMEELDKLGAIYSDRPRLEMGGELCGYAQTLVLMPYNAQLRQFRKYISRMVGTPNAVADYHAMEETETHRFLKHVLLGEVGLHDNLRRLSGAIIMKLTYGIEVQEKDDPFVRLIEHANDNFSTVTTPGLFLVDSFPVLQMMPAWFPGRHFKKLAQEYHKDFDDMVNVPYDFAKGLIAAGKSPSSFISRECENGERLSEQDISNIKYTAASIYGGGSDTTVSAQYAFFLAMVLHPSVQRKAQEELDQVVGLDRLPTFNDRTSLPYIAALVTESLRWNSVAPTGVPHLATEDRVIAGHFIPKRSIIITNLWAMLNDPAVYPIPATFDPERFLGPVETQQKDPRHACFGFGRRICVGMHLAEASLYILIARALSVFEISSVPGEALPVHEITSGTISQPKAFKCVIKPRSERALGLIAAEL